MRLPTKKRKSKKITERKKWSMMRKTTSRQLNRAHKESWTSPLAAPHARRVTNPSINLVEKGIVFAEDASNGLSHEKLLYNLDKIHPRLITRDPKSKLINTDCVSAKRVTYAKHPICGTNTGSGCCSKDAR